MEFIDKKINEELNKEASATETKKEDDFYFQGVFWVVADSVSDIFNDQFTLVSEKFLTDYLGSLKTEFNPKFWSHKDIWDKKFKSEYGVEYNYYPRGRVVVRDGKAWINLPREMYLPQIRDAVTSEFEIDKLDEVLDAIKKDSVGNHYNFLLK